MIWVEEACFAYPGKSDLVLKNISLKIRENEFVAIVGRNGSGKSTLARLLNGSLVPIRGKVWVDDLDTGKPRIDTKLRPRWVYYYHRRTIR